MPWLRIGKFISTRDDRFVLDYFDEFKRPAYDLLSMPPIRKLETYAVSLQVSCESADDLASILDCINVEQQYRLVLGQPEINRKSIYRRYTCTAIHDQRHLGALTVAMGFEGGNNTPEITELRA